MAGAGAVGGEQGRVFAVVEDEQAGQVVLPGGEHEAQLVLQFEGAVVGAQVEVAGSATGGDLGVYAGGVGKAEPEDAGEVAAIAVGKLGGQLGFADAAPAGGGGGLHLADGDGFAPFERAGEGAQLGFTTDEEWVGAQVQP